MLFVLVGFVLQFAVIKDFILKIIPVDKLIVLFAIGGIGFISFVVIWLYSNLKIISKIKEKLSGLIEGMTSLLKMEHKWAFLFHSFFIWFSYLCMFYVTIFALPETSNIGFNAVIIGFIFGTLAVGFTNSGFGAYPLLVAQIFVLYGVSDTAGTAFGWLVWTSQTLLTLVLGGLSFLFLPFLNKK
jgi:energy-converting hydrogenase Eha subunit C